ncbi:MAG: type secretion system protein [Proteobacteria bacterium]|nr:type secretion system protein [Pseudomonadota bacterium]
MRFAYKAVSASGRRVRGELDAGNLSDLEMRLLRMDLDLVAGRPARPARTLRRRRIPRRDLINFCFHLEQLSSAGVPLLDGLADLREAITPPDFRRLTASLIEGIEGGQTLSQAMAEHPAAFSRVFVNLVRAGEASGQLPEVLASLGASLKWEDELASHTKKLLLYPSLVAGIVLAASIFLMIYMVPQLKLFVSNMGQTLPAHTRLLFFVSQLLADCWFLFLLLPIAILSLLPIVVRHNPAARLRLDAAKLRCPGLGKILNKIILARFANTLAMLYAAGIPVLEALAITRLAVGNQRLQQALEEVEQLIREGRSVAGAFASAQLFPSLVVRMLHVGESTGKLDAALLNVAYFYNRDVKEAVAKAQTMIEPILTVGMGLMLGWIMLSVIGPIYEVIGRIKP